MGTRVRRRSTLLSVVLCALLALGVSTVAQPAAAAAPGVSHVGSAVSTGIASAIVPLKKVASKTPTIAGAKIATKKLTAKPGAWTRGTTFSYKWFADGKAISGANKSTLTLTSKHVGKRITVKVTGKKAGFTSVTKTSKATAKIKSGKARPASKTTCPKDYPIKGNQTTRHTTDWIYHVPGGQFYGRTHPEECFATERAAQQAGYRASKR